MRTWIAIVGGVWALSAVAFAAGTGFEGGNNLTITNYSGSVWVQCQDPTAAPSSQYYQCDGDDIEPGSIAAFVTQPGGDANSVELTATWESGKTATSEKGFDAATGKSTDTFNLAISTLLQHPLLGLGTNHVHYRLKRDGAVRSEGDFTATMHEDPVIHHCESGTVFLPAASQCNDSFFACDQYYSQAPRCE